MYHKSKSSSTNVSKPPPLTSHLLLRGAAWQRRVAAFAHVVVNVAQTLAQSQKRLRACTSTSLSACCYFDTTSYFTLFSAGISSQKMIGCSRGEGVRL